MEDEEKPRRGMASSLALPAAPRPVVVVGAGGIVRDAHLPAYARAGIPIAGIYDLDATRAEALAADFHTRALADLDAASDVPGAVFDLATPPQAHHAVLERLPHGAAVLIQKPLGRDLAEATAIVDLCRARGFTAAVNFQLRFAAAIRTLKAAIDAGELGILTDIELHVDTFTPWALFPSLVGLERMEITYHSIHYLDLIRYLAGEPRGAFARTLHQPGSAMAQTRTSAILDYGDTLRCTLSINHEHDFGRDHQDARLRVEGTAGAAVASLGVLLDYPRGEPDRLQIARRGGGAWRDVPLDGAWFPDAFGGPMANLQRFAAGEDDRLTSPVDDGWRTMALVEACYDANTMRGARIARLPEGPAE